MGLIEIASGNSVWRGLDYYNDKKVLSWQKSSAEEYDGIVAGSNGKNTQYVLIRRIRENRFVTAHLQMAAE